MYRFAFTATWYPQTRIVDQMRTDYGWLQQRTGRASGLLIVIDKLVLVALWSAENSSKTAKPWLDAPRLDICHPIV